ncbi:hypothetical protein BH10PSE6_BH10PSE6_15880 [soil metagenome]
MIANQPLSRLRALALTVALFAITSAVLQPLANAALLRIGSPEAAMRMWSAFCQPSAEDESGSANAKVHECCFGLAHAPVLALSSVAFLPVDRVDTTVSVVATNDRPTTGAIRDGPQQPRAPPLPID